MSSDDKLRIVLFVIGSVVILSMTLIIGFYAHQGHLATQETMKQCMEHGGTWLYSGCAK